MTCIKKTALDRLTGTTDARFRELLPDITTPPTMGEYRIDDVFSSGKGALGLLERINFALLHHFSPPSPIRDVEFLSSRMADREMPNGTVVHLSDGYFYVDETFSGSGAYVMLLKNYDSPNVAKIVCRGTAPRYLATSGYTSGLNNLEHQIGLSGVKRVWPAIRQALENVTHIEVLGKSLGGAHAQMLAVLINEASSACVTHLKTYCSVGVGDDINAVYNNQSNHFPITAIRNSDDYIPMVGGAHLGHRVFCTKEIIYISDLPATPLPLGKTASQVISLFQKSFGSAHRLQATLGTFHSLKVHNVDAHLALGSTLESLRAPIGRVVSFLMWQHPFADFYDGEITRA